jgi:hypothetical protein
METYQKYALIPKTSKTHDGRWAVGVEIGGTVDGKAVKRLFRAEDGISYLLEIEAEKEGINLGRNLVNRGLVGF